MRLGISIIKLTPQIKAHLGLLATNLFFAINISAIKFLTTKGFSGPYGLNVVRSGICVLLFWLLFLTAREKKKIDKKYIVRFLLCAFSALAANQMLFMKGVSLTYPIHASLLLLITPILITFIAAWVLKEMITVYKVIGLLLGITGACILILSGDSASKGNNILLGDFLVIMSTFLYTIYFILVKPLMQKYPTMVVMRWVFTFGFLMILPLGLNEFTQIPWGHYSLNEYLLLFMIVIPGTFLAYIFNAYGIKKLSASTAGTYIYSQPVFAVLIATIFLNETLELYKIIAGVVIFSGVYLANKSSKR
ncbi:MAG: DMT family transporter [Chitinophagaceae bacterium]|nr:DMT family transporter [Chitinophagaceae bacterium]